MDPTDLWTVDEAIADDVRTVLRLIREEHGKYPNDLGFEPEIEHIWQLWRAPRS